MSVLVLDAGNSIIKAKIARRDGGEIAFPHALRQLTESEYQRVLAKAKNGNEVDDYMKSNGTPYAIGESAERLGVVTKRSGTARYTRDYYGVLAAAALMSLYGRGREVNVFGSHPPGDVDFRDFLIQTVIADFEESFRSNNLEAVKDTSVLPPDRVRKAIITGIFIGGGQQFNCSEDVEEATSLFLNCFADSYQWLAGVSLVWDTIILTGGGSALLYTKLKPILKHRNIVLADDVNMLHLANVRGGLKLWRLYEMLEIV